MPFSQAGCLVPAGSVIWFAMLYLKGEAAIETRVRTRPPIADLSRRYDYSSAKIRYAAMDATSAEMSIAVIGTAIHQLVKSMADSESVDAASAR